MGIFARFERRFFSFSVQEKPRSAIILLTLHSEITVISHNSRNRMIDTFERRNVYKICFQ